MARLPKKRILTIGMTFAVALGTGFIVQYGDAVASRLGADTPVEGPNSRAKIDETVLIPVSANISIRSELPKIVASGPKSLTARTAPIQLDDPVPMEEPVPMLAAFEDVPTDIEPNAPIIVEADQCNMTLTAAEMKLAMVQLTLHAPCHADQVLAIHHEGMMFNAQTDAFGNLSVDVPALSSDAFFIAAFDGGEGAIAQVDVPDFAAYDRAVLQWQGEAGVQIHALEFGATYGDQGHIWVEHAGDFAAAVTGISGMMTRLGDATVLQSMMVDVYTFPTGVSSQDGTVALSVEAEVTSQNCGRDIAAQTIQLRPLQEPLVMNLSVNMPQCDAVGDFLVLKNMFQDLTLASR